MSRTDLALLLFCLSTAGLAQAPPIKNQYVEIKGTIERVQIARGQGMPSLELKVEDGTKRVLLGSMRYLMEHNFNPKAGSIAIVKGFLVDDSIAAQSVSIPSEKMTIRLRDENGIPLWRMCRQGCRGK